MDKIQKWKGNIPSFIQIDKKIIKFVKFFILNVFMVIANKIKLDEIL